MYHSLFGTLCLDLLQNRARIYVNCIAENRAPLPNCIGFMDGKNIFMFRPGGPNVNQRACYRGHERKRCVISLSVTTTDGMIFYLYSPEVKCRQDMILYRESGPDEASEKHAVVHGEQFYVHGDAAASVAPDRT